MSVERARRRGMVRAAPNRGLIAFSENLLLPEKCVGRIPAVSVSPGNGLKLSSIKNAARPPVGCSAAVNTGPPLPPLKMAPKVSLFA